MKMPFPCMLLLLLHPVTAQDPENFIRQHITQEMEFYECNDRMRVINNNAGNCKSENTFILATVNEVNAVCLQNENKENVISSEKFKIVVCDKPRGTYPDCEYHGLKMDSKIKISCVQGRAVHYKGSMDKRKG